VHRLRVDRPTGGIVIARIAILVAMLTAYAAGVAAPHPSANALALAAGIIGMAAIIRAEGQS
jgi:hypothetical protein